METTTFIILSVSTILFWVIVWYRLKKSALKKQFNLTKQKNEYN